MTNEVNTVGRQTTQGHENGLLGLGSICTILLIEIGWHDKLGQYSWVANQHKTMKAEANVLSRMCLYAPF